MSIYELAMRLYNRLVFFRSLPDYRFCQRLVGQLLELALDVPDDTLAVQCGEVRCREAADHLDTADQVVPVLGLLDRAAHAADHGLDRGTLGRGVGVTDQVVRVIEQSAR